MIESHAVVTDDHRFEFDLQGFLHLSGALTAAELDEIDTRGSAAEKLDVGRLNEDYPAGKQHQLNRPLSRIIDADPYFARYCDHPAVAPFLAEFLGPEYRHLDNDLYYTYPDYTGGPWHRGASPHVSGHVVDGRFRCPMVKVFYCLTGVRAGEGEFVVVPGSHKAHFDIDRHRRDLPAQHIFDHVEPGDVILFNEALIHSGRPNESQKTRKTLIVNFGRRDAGVFEGYRPRPETLGMVTARQREILSNERDSYWDEPLLDVAMRS